MLLARGIPGLLPAGPAAQLSTLYHSYSQPWVCFGCHSGLPVRTLPQLHSLNLMHSYSIPLTLVLPRTCTLVVSLPPHSLTPTFRSQRQLAILTYQEMKPVLGLGKGKQRQSIRTRAFRRANE